MTDLLVVCGLTKTYGATYAIENASFSVARGEIVVLVGPNGAGKSTLFKCLAGLVRPDAGSISMNLDSSRNVAARPLSYLSEFPELYGGLTVSEHINFIAQLYKLKNDNEFAKRLLKTFSLDDKLDKLPYELSQGMKRKLTLVMALLQGSQLLLLDEPFNGLDPRSAMDLRLLLRELSGAGTSIIVSTHRLQEAESFATRWLVLDLGQVLGDGSIDDLRKSVSMDGSATIEDIFLRLIALREAHA